MHVYKPPRVGGLDRVPVFTADTGGTRADLFELDGVTPMPGNVLVADTSGNLPSFQCAASPVYVGVSGSRTAWTPSESGDPTSSAASSWVAVKVTANHAAADHEIVFGDATGGNFNVTAPASGIFVVRNTGASGSAVVLPHAAEHVEGVASKSVGPGQALTFANDGTDWWVV